MTTPAADVAVVGGGVIGLSIAYVLARAGIRVTVLDRREMGREASWAGAGMIPSAGERPAASPVAAFRSWSARLYPQWAEALQSETGVDVGYRRTGGVDVAATADEDQVLQASAGQWRREGIAYERLAPSDFARVEPALNPALRVGYFLPDRAQVRNPRLLRALSEAVAKRGAVLRPGVPALAFEAKSGRIDAVRIEGETVPVGAVVIAAGAWSASLLEPFGINAPTPPIKGQIVLLRGDRLLLSRIVEHGKNYLVPRDDGRILVGATEENAGFDTNATDEGVRSLMGVALSLCPALAGAEVEKTWAGLRPGSIDTRPYLGKAPGFENLFVATGHGRAGLQLAPATAEVIGDLVQNRTPRANLSPFRIGREPARAVNDAFRS